MGIDLTLLLEPWENLPGTIYPSIQLPLSRRHDLWDRIHAELELQRLNQEIYWPDDDTGLVKRHDDCYGSPLRFVTAKEFTDLLEAFNDTDPHGPPWENVAAARYLTALPATKRIILWWH